jgi:site-specific recombinase XerD
MREVPFCFQCWPGGPVSAPPCRRCSSTKDYYTSGLCARCHPSAPGQRSPVWREAGPLAATLVIIDSCPFCFAWGVTRTYGWQCAACRSWAEKFPHVGDCPTCGRQTHLGEAGHCRLCFRQRSMVARLHGERPDRVRMQDANRHGQQLFFAGMWTGSGPSKPYVKTTVPADMSLLRPVGHRQLVFFDIARDLAAHPGLQLPPPPLPGLEAALMQFVADHARRYGWPRTKADRTRRAVRIMLAIQDTPGAPIRRSDVALLSRIKHSAQVVADVLDDAGMLEEDHTPAIERWFATATGDLPTPMRAELGIWFDVMRHGSATAPPRLPRHDNTTSTQLRWALPTIRQWATEHQSLWAIDAEHVHAVLPSAGTARATMLQGLRSIFRILKSRKAVFANPTARIRNPTGITRAPIAIDLAQVRSNLADGRPATEALTALLAFHAVRIYQLAELKLTDLHDGRLHINDRVILLAEPARDRLNTYLDHRQNTWPTSVNPHMFIHARNWTTTRPCTNWWIRKQLGTSGDRIRQDRILDEAHANGGDLRALCDLFGLSITGAARYASTVNPQLSEAP